MPRIYHKSRRVQTIGGFFETTRDAEWALLARAMSDTFEGYRAAAVHALRDDDFAYYEHRLLAVAVIDSAEIGVRRWSLDFFCAWNCGEGFLYGDIFDEVSTFWLGPANYDPIDDLAYRVGELSAKRRLAAEAAHRLTEAFGAGHAEHIVERIFEEVVSPHPACQLPARPARATGKLKGRAVA